MTESWQSSCFNVQGLIIRLACSYKWFSVLLNSGKVHYHIWLATLDRWGTFILNLMQEEYKNVPHLSLNIKLFLLKIILKQAMSFH